MSSNRDHVEDDTLARRQDLSRLTREERAIYSKVSRRAFVGVTAAATLASLVGYKPAQLRASGPEKPPSGSSPSATADAVIVLWTAGGVASTDAFQPKRYTALTPGVPINDVLSTIQRI